jgi:purine-binding chemotaxis protein CheW
VIRDGAAVPARLLLVFIVEDQAHALAVEHVVEVVRMVAATPLAAAPVWVGGAINFRGRVIPLIDVRARLGGPRREPDLSTSIIVVETSEMLAGLLVDEVEAVLALDDQAITPSGSVVADSPVSGVARDRERLIVVLDPERLCADSGALAVPSPEEMARAQSH